MRRIALVNQKGGCGKTTTAINLSSCLAEKGRKVLLIDLDPQGHSGLGLGITSSQIQETIYEALSGETQISEVIHTIRENLDIIFSNVVLSAFEQKMAGAPAREFRLKQCLMGLENTYDYIILDCPPSIGLLTFNALIASDEAIIPVDSSAFSLNGLGKLLETIQLIEKKIGHELIVRVLPTNIDRRTNFSTYLVETLKSRFPKNCLKTFINSCTRLKEAAYHGKPIIEYDKYCAAFEDYQELAREIIRQEARVRRILQKTKRISFVLEAPENANVQIAGDFNNWVPVGLHLIEAEGKKVWQADIPLMPGTYEYKYVVNGNWMPDPANDKTVEGTFGGINSVIIV